MAAVIHYLYLCQFSWMLIQVGTSFPPSAPFSFPVCLDGVAFISDILYTEVEVIPYICHCIPRRSMQEKPYKLYNIRKCSEFEEMKRNLVELEIREW